MSVIKTVVSHKKVFVVSIGAFIFYLLVVLLAFSFFVWEQFSPNEYLKVDETLSGFGILGSIAWMIYAIGVIATFPLFTLIEWLLSITGNYYINLKDYGLYDCGSGWISICFPSYLGAVTALTIYLIIIFLLNYLVYKKFFSVTNKSL